MPGFADVAVGGESVEVLAQPLKGSFGARVMAAPLFAFGEDLEEEFGAASVEFAGSPARRGRAGRRGRSGRMALGARSLTASASSFVHRAGGRVMHDRRGRCGPTG